MGAVRGIGRHQVGDIAQHQQFAGFGVQDHARIDAAVDAADDQRLGILAELGELFEPLAALLPAMGAEAAVAFDQAFHAGFRSWSAC